MEQDFAKVIVLEVNDERYGIDIQHVKSIEHVQQITWVPNAPEAVLGITNFRGEIIPIIDLQKKFGMGDMKTSGETRIVITQVEEITVGLIVDLARDVVDINGEAIDAAPESVDGVKSEFTNGLAKLDDKLVTLINLPKLLDVDDEESKQEVVSE